MNYRRAGNTARVLILMLFLAGGGFVWRSGVAGREAVGGAVPDAAGKATFRIGHLRPSPALAVYVVADGRPCPVRLTVRRGWRKEGDRLLLRVFDPAEKQVFWQYLEPGGMADTFGPGTMEIWGIPIAIPDNIVESQDLLADIDLEMKEAGVYQFRAVAGAHNSLIGLEFPRELPFGVSFQNGAYYPWDPAVSRAYVYIPPRAEVLKIRGTGVRVIDDAGNTVYPVEKHDPRKTTVVPIERNETVWTFEFPDPKKWSFSAAGMPVILCGSRAAAEAIRASVEVLDDGTAVCHKFQRRIAEILPRVLAPENVGRNEDLVVPFNADTEAWLTNPRRNALLLGAYSLYPSLYFALTQQNLDPNCHWGGSIGFKAWREKLDKAAPENRWDRFLPLKGCWGASAPGNVGEALAQAFALDAPFNPYFGKKELLYRAAACSLRDLMTLSEYETPLEMGSDIDPYPGLPAFVLGRKHFHEYALAAPHMPADVREVWTEGLRRLVDRHFTDVLVTCRNQSSHFLLSWQMFADGSGDPRYLDLARRFAQRFARGAHPAGFHIEACGPDATYCGMQHWHMAVYYRMSKDPVMLDAIRKSYNFFNHTVAPEPNGQALGGFNFAHRTPSGFHVEQWDGARGILDDVLPEVGLWAARRTADDEAARDAEARRTLLARLGSGKVDAPAWPTLTAPRYFYWTDKPDTTGVWPAAEIRPFVRNFADQLIAVRRPAYYTAIYVGKPAAPYYVRNVNLRNPLPKDVENRGGDARGFYRSLHAAVPLLGGGMTLFATPEYGNAILTSNFSPLCHHGLVAIDTGGGRWWSDYHATAFNLDAARGALTITGRIENHPIEYERRYSFEDNEVAVRVDIHAKGDTNLKDFFENVPLAGGPCKTRDAVISTGATERPLPFDDGDGAKELKTGLSAATAGAFRIVDRDGNGVMVELDRERDLTICRSGASSGRIRFDRVQIMLTGVMKKGDRLTLTYRIKPFVKK